MKILFSVGDLEKDLNATTKIVVQLAEKLGSLGHSCMIAGECSVYPQDEKTGNVVLKRLPSAKGIVKASEAFDDFFRKKAEDRNTARGTFVKRHPIHSIFLFLKYHPRYIQYQQKRYLRQINQLVAEFKPDAVVAVCKPVLPFETVAMNVSGCPVYLYQVDPFGLHRIDNPEDKNGFIGRETAVFERAEHIFTTPALLRQYSEAEEYKNYTPKMTAVEFPNINKHIFAETVKPAIEFSGEYINLLFCGIVTDQFRSPAKLLKLLEPLFDKGEKIRVYFLGDNMSATVTEYCLRYPDNVIAKDRVPAETALATMNDADVLFNISNTLDNQVPSKIFDYFSMGKPVLNLQKIENCPAEEYFAKYPLCYNLKEFEPADADSLLEFLKKAKGQQMAFADVEKIYAEATVDYVADVMEKVFEENIN